MPSPSSRKRSKVLAFVAVASLFGAAFGYAVFHSGYFLLKYRLSEAKNGHLQDLSILSDYLANSNSDSEKLSERSAALERLLREYGVDHTAEEALGLVDPKILNEACGSTAIRNADSPLAEYCEKITLRSNSENEIPNCETLKFENNRKACRRENDARFSTNGSAHCSTAECLVDNAVFQSALKGGNPCANIHPSLLEACKKTTDSYASYVRNPEDFSDERLEGVLLWKDRNAVSLAARSAVLEFPDSPSSACASLAQDDVPKCEKLSKELFSYVQKRGLRNRFARIAQALEKARKTTPSE